MLVVYSHKKGEKSLFLQLWLYWESSGKSLFRKIYEIIQSMILNAGNLFTKHGKGLKYSTVENLFQQ